jgi:hypothetical protein
MRFLKSASDVRYGAILEVGSGSVMASVVVSDSSKSHPDIIWTKREFANIGSNRDEAQNLKGLLTALMNIMLALDGEGRTALRETYPTARIGHLQITISAPWSYTISKMATYEQTESFIITDDIIRSLTDAAQAKVTEALAASDQVGEAGLTIMTRATSDISANGYRTMDPIGKRASTITVTQISALAQAHITDAIADLRDRTLPHITTERYSAMLVFHCIIRDLFPNSSEYCLVDLTYEATEIAIIRDGVLQYCTHTNIGINTLIRTISSSLTIPETEARLLLSQYTEAETACTPAQVDVIKKVLLQYEDALETLFHETGDSLSIPKPIYLHGTYEHEGIFDELIKQAAKRATSGIHSLHLTSHDVLTNAYTETEQAEVLRSSRDTGALMAAQFFHRQQFGNNFEQK